ncbi:hypothetical protein, partial [Promicromonospora kroppenstedtii]|uniref:hypothetical protein n=1 Tax=Promicromonospora kroppenstedtii TaxID=440482 RepID=UPI00056A3387
LVALDVDPARWGIDDEVVPGGYDLGRLKERLPRLDLNQRPSDYVQPQVKGGSYGRYMRVVGSEVAA